MPLQSKGTNNMEVQHKILKKVFSVIGHQTKQLHKLVWTYITTNNTHIQPYVHRPNVISNYYKVLDNRQVKITYHHSVFKLKFR